MTLLFILYQPDGADRITRFFLGIARRYESPLIIHSATVNAGLGMLTFRDGQLISVAGVSIQDGQIKAIYSVCHPEKIRTCAK
jgi:RNA polymerase sigma-70 factor, ECF subfamily